MIELEEISPYGIYRHKGKSIQLLEKHFAGDILAMAKELTGIPVDSHQLWLLGFQRDINTEICSKIWKECKVIIAPTKHSGHILQFPGIPNAGYVQHIHQVQRLWYSHFQEHLWLPKAEVKAPPKSVVVEAKVISEKYVNKNRTYVNHTTIQPEDQEYYLSWDSRLLIRPVGWVVWRVSEKSPLFEHAGRTWGLTLLSGKAVEEDRIKAGKWLRNFLST